MESENPRNPSRGTKSVLSIARGYAKGMTRSAWKALLRSMQQVLTAEQEARVTAPTVVFGRRKAPCFASTHSDPLVVEMKIGIAIIWRILIDIGNSMDIITWDCLKKLTYPG